MEVCITPVVDGLDAVPTVDFFVMVKFNSLQLWVNMQAVNAQCCCGVWFWVLLDWFMEAVQINQGVGGKEPAAAHCVGCLHLVNGKLNTVMKELVRDHQAGEDGVQFVVTKEDAASGQATIHVQVVNTGEQNFCAGFLGLAWNMPKQGAQLGVALACGEGVKEEISVFAEEGVHDLKDFHSNLLFFFHDVAGQEI